MSNKIGKGHPQGVSLCSAREIGIKFASSKNKKKYNALTSVRYAASDYIEVRERIGGKDE